MNVKGNYERGKKSKMEFYNSVLVFPNLKSETCMYLHLKQSKCNILSLNTAQVENHDVLRLA